jgi:hypothetical protein
MLTPPTLATVLIMPPPGADHSSAVVVTVRTKLDAVCVVW